MDAKTKAEVTVRDGSDTDQDEETCTDEEWESTRADQEGERTRREQEGERTRADQDRERTRTDQDGKMCIDEDGGTQGGQEKRRCGKQRWLGSKLRHRRFDLGCI